MKILHSLGIALSLAVCASQAGSADEAPLYKNPSAPIPARIDDLMKRMTLEE